MVLPTLPIVMFVFSIGHMPTPMTAGRGRAAGTAGGSRTFAGMAFRILLGTVFAASVLHAGAAALFRRRARRMAAELGRAAAAEVRPAVPQLVQKFADRAPAADRPLRTVQLRQRAAMRMTAQGRWHRLSAEETIAIREPGFVWLARMRVAPLVWVAILDAYVDGKGLLELRLFGSLPLVRVQGREIDRSEAMRYLAELPWAPEAMLHNPRLGWRQIDAATVEVATETAGGPARVRLCFEGGDVARIEALNRPRAVGSGTVPTPWYGRFDAYREIGGRRIPSRASVGWRLDDSPFEYWRGEVTRSAVS